MTTLTQLTGIMFAVFSVKGATEAMMVVFCLWWHLEAEFLLHCVVRQVKDKRDFKATGLQVV